MYDILVIILLLIIIYLIINMIDCCELDRGDKMFIPAKTICDICGKEISMSEETHFGNMDICKSCFKKIKKYVEYLKQNNDS